MPDEFSNHVARLEYDKNKNGMPNAHLLSKIHNTAKLPTRALKKYLANYFQNGQISFRFLLAKYALSSNYIVKPSILDKTVL